jgi:hypothetical protein
VVIRLDASKLLQAIGVPALVFDGGCVARGEGSSFRASAHAHTTPGIHNGWVCVRSPKRVLTSSGAPSRLLLHEAAHILAPRATHGSPAFVKALASVGIRTDSYSRAGRNRRDAAAGVRAGR